MTGYEKAILLIEDDNDIRDSMQILLESEGFRVIPASNGKEGLELLTSMKDPCLVLLDVFMPVMDADDFLIEMATRHLYDAEKFPVVIVTAAPPGSEAVRKARTKSVGYIKKPIDIEDLLKIVQSFCRKSGETAA